MWDTAVGGHIGLNEKIEEALKREAQEELGITDFKVRFKGSYTWESPEKGSWFSPSFVSVTTVSTSTTMK